MSRPGDRRRAGRSLKPGRALASRRLRAPVARRSGGRRRPGRGPRQSGRPRRRLSLGPPRLGRTGWTIVAVAVVALCLGASRLRDSLTTLLVITEAAAEERLEEALDVRALVVRGEWVVTSPADGRLRVAVSPGQRVRAGAVLAEVESQARRDDLEAELRAVEADLARQRATLLPRLEELSARAAQLEASVRAGALAWSAAAVAGRVSELPRLSAELEQLARDRARARGQEAEDRARLETLQRRRAALQDTLAGVQQVVLAPGAGMFSLRLDGLEEQLVPARRAELSPARLFSFRPRQAGPTGLEVKAGDPLFKVVDPMEVYLGMSLPTARAEALAAAPRMWVEYGTGQEVEADLAGLGPADRGGQRVLWLGVVGAPEAFLEARRAEVRLAWRRWEGVTVPAGAVVQRRGQAGVFVVEKTSAHFEPVEVKFSAPGRTGVGGIAPGTRVIRNPWLVTEGSPVR